MKEPKLNSTSQIIKFLDGIPKSYRTLAHERWLELEPHKRYYTTKLVVMSYLLRNKLGKK